MILCCGEVLIDMIFVIIDVGEGFVLYVGGVIYNMVIGFGWLGFDVVMVMGLLCDFFG